MRSSGEEGARKEQGPQKERETKDDGRYIIFYTFEDEVDSDEPSLEEGDAAP